MNEKTKVCELCEEQPATLLCVECYKCYCSGCSEVVHRVTGKKEHKTEPIPKGVRVDAMAKLIVAELSKKQQEIDENVASVKTEIKTVFNRIRDLLNAQEDALLKEVERFSDELSLSNIASRISDTEEEVTKAISAGQEALECMKKE